MNSISKAAKVFFDRANDFVYPSLLQFFLSLAFLLGAIGIYFFISGLFGVMGIRPGDSYIIILAILSFIYIVILAGLKGAWVKGIIHALEGDRIKLYEYIRYALSKSLSFFGVVLIKLIVVTILFSPIVYLYINDPSVFSSDVVKVVLTFIYLIIIFFVEYFFYLAFPIIAGYNVGFMRSIILSFKLSVRHFKDFFIPFFIMGFVFITNFIPLIDILTYLVLYPIVYSAFIINLASIEGEISEKDAVEHKKHKKYKGRHR